MRKELWHEGTQSFWEGLSPGARHALKSFAQPSHYPKGSTLFRAGDPAHGVFLLGTGRVRLSAALTKARSLVFRTAHAGQALGLSATVRDQPHEASAEAVTSCQADFVARADFLHFLDQYPEARFQVVCMLSHELFAANEQLRFLRWARSASSRLALLLLAWCAEAGVDSHHGIRLKVPLTERDMGQMLGVSRETIVRALARLKEARIAEYSGRILLVRDREALASMASPLARWSVDTGISLPRPELL